MIRSLRRSLVPGAALGAALFSAACSGTRTSAAAPPEPAPVAVHAAPIQSQAIDRFLRVTGSLAADEQADVAAETAGRVIGTPVERGTRVTAGTVLIRVSATEADASLREADANAAQLEARLGLATGQPFDPAKVPDVLNAKASLDWAEADFNRIKSLLEQKVVSQAEYDQRLTQVQAARQQYQSAQNGAQQSYRSLQAARARVDRLPDAIYHVVLHLADEAEALPVAADPRDAAVQEHEREVLGVLLAELVVAQEHRAQLLDRVLGRRPRPAAVLEEEAEALFGKREEDVVLAGEVTVDGRRAVFDPLGDLADGNLMVAVGHEELAGGVQDGPGHRLALAFLPFFDAQVIDS